MTFVFYNGSLVMCHASVVAHLNNCMRFKSKN